MIKFFRKIHLWLSVPFGIIITLVCFSGAMLIFEPEITRAVQKDVYYVAEEKAEAIPMEKLMETVKQTLPDSVSITGVTVFSDKSRTYQVNLSKPRRASIFINQYSGEITGRYERLGFFSTMFKLHRWLLDSANPHGDGMKVGKLLVGISTLIFVIALLTGIVIWWPRARANVRRSLSISFKHGWKGFWNGFHVAGGMWALLIILAMALTGLTWSFDWYRSAFYAVCGVEHTPRNMGEGGASGNGQGNPERNRRGSGEGRPEGDRGEHRRGNGERPSEFADWQKIYDLVIAQNPGVPQITVSKDGASVTLGTTGNPRASDKYSYDAEKNTVTVTKAYGDSTPADKLRGWIYSIHTGALGGIITRIIWFLAALLGASLPLTGYYLWIRRLTHRKPKPTKATK